MTKPALWTDREAALATGGRGTAAWRATGVSIDSRTIEPGDLFVAIAGDNRDGHDFVAMAFAAGAGAALVSTVPPDLPAGAPLLIVADTLAALRALGADARARSEARIVAVTGSVGKTGTKEALRHMLERQGVTSASRGSLNNQWGVPQSLARLPPAARYGIFEIGMNHAGEITPLARLVRPHVAVITTVDPVHLAFFASVEEIADAKAEIFAGVEAGGTAILNADNPHFMRLAAASRRHIANLITFGTEVDADFRLVDCDLGPDGSRVRAAIRGRPIDYRLGPPGRHWVINSLAALATVEALGGDVERAARELGDLEVMPGRGRRLPVPLNGGTIEVIDESYNANPASMRAAFDVLALSRPTGNGRRIAVLGDMLELGEHGPALHMELGRDLAARPIDLVYAAGPLMASLYGVLPARQRGGHAGNAKILAPLLLDALRPGDVVMVKGSLGTGMHHIVQTQAQPRPPLRHAANGG